MKGIPRETDSLMYVCMFCGHQPQGAFYLRKLPNAEAGFYFSSICLAGLGLGIFLRFLYKRIVFFSFGRAGRFLFQELLSTSTCFFKRGKMEHGRRVTAFGIKNVHSHVDFSKHSTELAVLDLLVKSWRSNPRLPRALNHP